jgi:SRSO17 transposase
VENCQIGVFLSYASRYGRALIDRELYLPKSWTDDPARCEKAGVPADVEFRTKPELAQAMVTRALDEGMPATWFTADSVYGDSPTLRAALEARPIGYVIGTSLNDANVPIELDIVGLRAAIDAIEPDQWHRLSAGAGSQGERWYEWAQIELSTFPRRDWRRSILVRRSLSDPNALSAYRCFYPDGTSIETLVRVAGCRWTIETDFEEAKGEVGLDHYEVRSWTGWYRHISLAMLAHAFLAVMKATSNATAVEAIRKGAQIQDQSTMGAFKASRGLSSP